MRLWLVTVLFALSVVVYSVNPSTFHAYGDSFTHGATQSPNYWRILGVEYIVNHSNTHGLGYGWLDDNETYNTYGGSGTSSGLYGTNMQDNYPTDVLGWGNGTTVFATSEPRRDILYNRSDLVCSAIDKILYNVSESNEFSVMLSSDPSLFSRDNSYDHDTLWENWGNWTHCNYDYAIKHGFKVLEFTYRLNNNYTLTAAEEEANPTHPGPDGGKVMALELNRSFYRDMWNTTHFTYRTFTNHRHSMESTGYSFDVDGLTFDDNATLNWVSFEDVNPKGMTIKTLITNTSIPHVDVSVEMPGNWEADTRYLFEVDNVSNQDYFVKTTNSTGHMNFKIDSIGRGVVVNVKYEKHAGLVGRDFSYSGVLFS